MIISPVPNLHFAQRNIYRNIYKKECKPSEESILESSQKRARRARSWRPYAASLSWFRPVISERLLSVLSEKQRWRGESTTCRQWGQM